MREGILAFVWIWGPIRNSESSGSLEYPDNIILIFISRKYTSWFLAWGFGNPLLTALAAKHCVPIL